MGSSANMATLSIKKRSQSPSFSSVVDEIDNKIPRTDQHTPINYLGKPVEIFELGQKYSYQRFESLPEILFFDPITGAVQDMVEEDMHEIGTAVFVGRSDLDFELLKFNDDVHQGGTVVHSKIVRIGLVGDAGAGKSSFLNALLGYHDLALTGDGGSSCTQVVTEYVASSDDFPANTAIVQFKPKSAIDAEIEMHFRNCVKFATDATSDKEDETAATRGCTEDEGRTAITALTQIFAHDPRMATAEDLIASVTDLSRQQQFDKIQELQFLCEAELQQHFTNHRERQVHIESMDLDGVKMSLRQYTQMQDPGIGFWPVVETAQVSLDSSILRQGSGCYLADIPGRNDKNVSRRKTTEAYLSRCDLIILVGKCDRILDDLSIQNQLKDFVVQKGPNKVVLVATKMDEINETPTEGLSAAERARITAYQTALDKARLDLSRSMSSPSEFMAARMAVDKASAALTGQRALARNAIIIKGFERQFKMGKGIMAQASEVTVIPVSSKIQASYMRGEGATEPLCFTPAETGIPEARAVICAKALTGRFDAVERHVTMDVPGIINKLEIVLNKSPHQRIDNMRGLIKRWQNTATEGIPNHQSEIADALTAVISRKLLPNFAAERCPWPKAVFNLIQGWKPQIKTVTSIKAFAKRQGTHQPRGFLDPINFNREFLAQPREDLSEMVDAFQEELLKIKLNINNEVTQRLRSLQKDFKNNTHLGGTDADLFWSNFSIYMKNFSMSLDSRCSKFTDAMRSEFDDLASSKGITPFNVAMSKVYRSIVDQKGFGPAVKGTTAGQRCFDTLYSNMKLSKSSNSSNPFHALQGSVEKKFQELLTNEMQGLVQTITQPFADILDDLELKFGSNGGHYTPPHSREAMKFALAKVLPRFRQRHAERVEALAEIKARFAESSSKTKKQV